MYENFLYVPVAEAYLLVNISQKLWVDLLEIFFQGGDEKTSDVGGSRAGQEMVVPLGLVLPWAVAFTRDYRDYPIIIVIGAEDIHHRLGLTGKYRQSGVDLFEEPGGGFFGGGLDDEAGAEVAGEWVYTVVVYTRIRLSYKLGYLFIQRHDAPCHRLEVGVVRCRCAATGPVVEDGEGSESPCQFQEVIPLRQYQLRSMFPGRDREMLGEDRVGVAQYQMAKAERQSLLFHRQVLGT